MKIQASYPVRLRQVRDESALYLKHTHRIYNEIISLLVPIIDKHWHQITQYKLAHPKDQHAQRTYVERLTHKTKNNPHPQHDTIDTQYPKYPAYYRRAAITEAIGIVSSHKTRYRQWEDNGKHGKLPRLPQVYKHQNPCLYVKGSFNF